MKKILFGAGTVLALVVFISARYVSEPTRTDCDELSKKVEQLEFRTKEDAYQLLKLKKESETLRMIMRSYIHCIDSLTMLTNEQQRKIKQLEKK